MEPWPGHCQRSLHQDINKVGGARLWNRDMYTTSNTRKGIVYISATLIFGGCRSFTSIMLWF